jgi:transcriptional regulator with XRE-family HTH domain
MWSGKMLIDKRKSLNMTQMAMARTLGVSHRMYCYYEKGEQSIPRSAELAVRWMEYNNADGIFRVAPHPDKSLTSFDRERISRLCDALGGIEGADAQMDKVLQQSKKELEYLLSKFEE